MKYIGLFYGGRGYGAPDGHNLEDCESFNSIAHAARVFESRVDFDPYYPCVDETAELHLYTGTEYHENGPDYILTIGPRGGIRCERS